MESACTALTPKCGFTRQHVVSATGVLFAIGGLRPVNTCFGLLPGVAVRGRSLSASCSPQLVQHTKQKQKHSEAESRTARLTPLRLPRPDQGYWCLDGFHIE